DLQHCAEALRLTQHCRLELLQLVGETAEQSGRADGLRRLDSIRHRSSGGETLHQEWTTGAGCVQTTPEDVLRTAFVRAGQWASAQLFPTPTSTSRGTRSCATPIMLLRASSTARSSSSSGASKSSSSWT